jgi:hypothetical protein
MNANLAALRKFFPLIFLAVTLNGCALVYSGSVKAGDNQRAVAVSQVLEAEYRSQGLQKENMPPQTQAYYWTSWFSAPGTRYEAIWVGDWVKDGTVHIRIVPQPSCNDAARAFGEHMQDFMTNNFPHLEWSLTGKSEPDLFR